MKGHEGKVPAPVHLEEVGQIAVTVSDLQRSKDFYQSALGMQFLFDAGGMAFFQCGKIRSAIGTSPDTPSSGGTILYFRVADIHETHSLLAARGVEFIQKPHLVARMGDHELWIAFLRDPDGNPVGLMSEVPLAASPAAQ
ncbi:MAG: VOC family protein [Terracidiphilus sp.]|jgi:methylmalonyl-CoA/ethylmalonyl-CoA epimerase